MLGPADAGIAQWQPLKLTADVFEGGRLFEIDNALLVFGSRGEAQRVDCSPP